MFAVLRGLCAAKTHINTVSTRGLLDMELSQQTEERVVNAPRRRGARLDRTPRPSYIAARASSIEKRAVGLGWFSVGLGLAQVLAPRQVARLIGADEDDESTRAILMGIGVRELTCAVGLLSKSRPAAWAWARFAGDVMDLALLGRLWRTNPVSRERMLGVGGAVLGATWADAQSAVALSRAQVRPLAHGIAVKQVVTVQRTPEEAYAFFRDLENLPRFMSHLDSVVEADGRSQWSAIGPLGIRVEWEAEVVEDRPGELIAWRSLPGADVPNRGLVHFHAAPGGLGTEICVELSYDPPVGAVGQTLASLFGREPSQQISADLRRLKQMLETGEVLHSDASVHRGMHPARPATDSKPKKDRS
jgi:uncharacterized membrane protein